MYISFLQAEDGIRDGHVTGVQTCALPISPRICGCTSRRPRSGSTWCEHCEQDLPAVRHACTARRPGPGSVIDYVETDRKSTRLNSSHVAISYAVFCLITKRRDICRRSMFDYEALKVGEQA